MFNQFIRKLLEGLRLKTLPEKEEKIFVYENFLKLQALNFLKILFSVVGNYLECIYSLGGNFLFPPPRKGVKNSEYPHDMLFNYCCIAHCIPD